MKIILDVMGGDNPPAEFVRAAIAASNEYGCEMILVGDEAAIRETLTPKAERKGKFRIVHCDEFITMDDDPMSIVKKKSGSSMSKALKLIESGEGDAVVSAGNTGALFTGASLIVRRVKGVRRAALATVLPLAKPVLLLDCGANAVVMPEYLWQFAVMGSVYAEKVLKAENPAVGLLNNGTEEHKGTGIHQDAYKLMKGDPSLNFAGNVEGKDVPFGACDVVVADGFSGNVLLKALEGMARFTYERFEKAFSGGIASHLSGFIVREKIKAAKAELGISENGGAPFLGLTKPVIKTHGNSDADAVKNAVGKAIAYAETGVIDEIAERMKGMAE